MVIADQDCGISQQFVGDNEIVNNRQIQKAAVGHVT